MLSLDSDLPTQCFVLPKPPLGYELSSVEVGIKSAMLAKTHPVLLLCACASSTRLPTADQPEFAEMAQPYASQLQAVGITRVISPGSGAAVLLQTEYGAVTSGTHRRWNRSRSF